MVVRFEVGSADESTLVTLVTALVWILETGCIKSFLCRHLSQEGFTLLFNLYQLFQLGCKPHTHQAWLYRQNQLVATATKSSNKVH